MRRLIEALPIHLKFLHGLPTFSMKSPILLQIRWSWSRETILIEPSNPPKAGDIFLTTELWDGYSWQIEYQTRVIKYEDNGATHTLVLEYSQSENPDLSNLDILWGKSTLVFDIEKESCSATWENDPPSKKYDGPGKAKLILADDGEFLGYVTTLRLKRQQGAFKSQLLKTVKKCELTGEEEIRALDAAHIVEVSDNGSHDPTNGLLLRTDIHRLFDRRLLHISPEDGKVTLSSEISKDSNYHKLLKNCELSDSSLQRVRKNLDKRARNG
jgi:hypothetical protein